jgi:hypothetical protein
MGSIILTAIGIHTSIVGCRARLSSYMLARCFSIWRSRCR